MRPYKKKLYYSPRQQKQNKMSEKEPNKDIPEQEKIAEGLYVSWEVAPVCDLACPHCYSLYEEQEHDFKESSYLPQLPIPYFEKLSLEYIEKGLDNLQKAGAKFVNIEGGEPTLRSDIISILKAAKDRDMETIMSTHGMYLLKSDRPNQPILAERLVGVLDVLSISLDADTREINDSIRRKKSGQPSNHFDKIIEFLKWYGEEFKQRQEAGNPLYRLKINTVVMQNNMDAVPGIVEIIKNLVPTEAGVQLKLVQFQPRGKGRENKDSLLISVDEFEAVVQKTKKMSGNDVSISVRKYSEEKYPFFVIGFNGEIVVPEGERQDVVETSGDNLNVLDNDFYDNLKIFIDHNPQFLRENKKINSYD